MDRLVQLHVASDLHLGGPPGRQIFDQGAELAALIDHVRQLDPDARVGLLLNGDIVDFLAEDGAKYLDPKGAVTKLRRIFTDVAFACVWDALRRFTAHERRVLVLVLGNHDVELALPDVQEELLARICADDAARGRVRIAMDGTGWACLVGGRRVLCTHGNEVDSWNVVDGKALRDVVRALKQGATVDAWEPNAGTKLVIDVMNGIKHDYPLVDLLKPENKAVPPVVFALAPKKVVGPLSEAAPILLRKVWDSARIKANFLGQTSTTPDAGTLHKDDALSMLLAGQSEDQRPEDSADPRSGQAELFNRIASSGSSATSPGGTALLGGLDVPLRAALKKWLGKDRTFEIDAVDAAFKDLDRAVAPEVDFLLAGHTHLERALPRVRGNGFYFNSGTWIRLLRLDEAMLASDTSFTPILDVFRAGNLEALDTIPGLVVRRNTLVSIVAAGDWVQGSLAHISLVAGALKIHTLEPSVLKMRAAP